MFYKAFEEVLNEKCHLDLKFHKPDSAQKHKEAEYIKDVESIFN